MKKAQNKHMDMQNTEAPKAMKHGMMLVDGEVQDVVLDAETVESLLFMIEEEKMARDIYDALYEQTGIKTFDTISNSEQKHYDTLLSAASKLGVDTSALSDEAGVYSNSEIQELYTTLLAQGSLSSEDAIDVGILIEQTDIEDLQNAIDSNVDTTLLGQVYSNLLDASQHHLDAFETVA